AGEAAGKYAITQGTLSLSSDYILSFTGANLTIGQAPLTITANDQSMPYGGSIPSLTVHYTGLVNGDTFASLTTAPTVSTSATPSSLPGPYSITASGAVDANY